MKQPHPSIPLRTSSVPLLPPFPPRTSFPQPPTLKGCPQVQEVGRQAYLEVADHQKACSIGTACDERCGVNPGMTTLLQKLPIAQEADQGHHESTQVANEAEEAALWGVCAAPAARRWGKDKVREGQEHQRAPILAYLLSLALLRLLCSRQATDL